MASGRTVHTAGQVRGTYTDCRVVIVCVGDGGVVHRRAGSSRYLCYEIATAREVCRAVALRDTETPIGVEPCGLTKSRSRWREPHVCTSVVSCHLACVARESEKVREREGGGESETAYVARASAAPISASRREGRRGQEEEEEEEKGIIVIAFAVENAAAAQTAVPTASRLLGLQG